MKYLFNIFLCLALLVSCERTEPPGGLLPNPEPPVEEQPPVDEPPVDETPAITQINHPGLMYVWDESVIPEITVHIKKDEWNALLKRYDEFDHNVDYFHADFTYKKGDEDVERQVMTDIVCRPLAVMFYLLGFRGSYHRMSGTAILEKFHGDEVVERIEAPAMWEQMCFKPDRIK